MALQCMLASKLPSPHCASRVCQTHTVGFQLKGQHVLTAAASLVSARRLQSAVQARETKAEKKLQIIHQQLLLSLSLPGLLGSLSLLLTSQVVTAAHPMIDLLDHALVLLRPVALHCTVGACGFGQDPTKEQAKVGEATMCGKNIVMRPSKQFVWVLSKKGKI